MSASLCLGAALTSMVLYGVASAVQAAAARRAHGPRVVLHPLYLLGLVADLLAWAASLVALVRLPLVVVQPVLAGSVAAAVLLAVPLLGLRLRARDTAGVAATTAGLVLVALAAGPESDAAAPAWFRVALLGGLVLCLAAVAATCRHGMPTVVAAVAGTAFAGAALAGRVTAATTDVTSRHAVPAALVDPVAWAVVGCVVLALSPAQEALAEAP